MYFDNPTLYYHINRPYISSTTITCIGRNNWQFVVDRADGFSSWATIIPYICNSFLIALQFITQIVIAVITYKGNS